MKWAVKIDGLTHLPDGRKRTVNATVEGMGDAHGAILRYMLARPRPWEWYGVEVRGITPLGQRVYVLIEPDYLTNRPAHWTA